MHNKSIQAKGRLGDSARIQTFLFISTSLALLLIKFFPTNRFASNHVGYSSFANSDTLAFWDFGHSLLAGNGIRSWYWGPHSFIFPDLFLIMCGIALHLSWLTTYFLIGYSNYFFCLMIFRKVFSPAGVIFFQCIAILGLAGITPFDDLWKPGFHILYYCFGIYIFSTSQKIRTFKKILFPILLISTFLFAMSDEQFSIILLICFFILSALRLFRFMHAGKILSIYEFSFALTSGIGWVVQNLLVTSHYRVLFDLNSVNSNIALVLNSGHIFLIISFLSLATILLFFDSLIFNSGVSFKDPKYENSLSIYFACFIPAVLSLGVTEIPWQSRYFETLTLFAIPSYILIKKGVKKEFNITKKYHFKFWNKKFIKGPLVLGLLILLLFPAVTPQDEHEMCLDTKMNAYFPGVTRIIGASYWDARKYRILSTRKDIVVPLTEVSYLKYPWLAKKTELVPQFNTLFINSAQPISNEMKLKFATIVGRCDDTLIAVQAQR